MQRTKCPRAGTKIPGAKRNGFDVLDSARLEGNIFAQTLMVVMALILCVEIRADQIILKNGDRLTGKISELDDEELNLKSELVGAVTVQWMDIEGISSTQPVYITLKDERSLLGTLATRDGKVEIQTKEGGNVTIAKDLIESIRSPGEESAYQAETDRQGKPSLFDFWGGAIDAGLSTTRGNAATTTLELGMSAARTTPQDKLSLYLTSLYADANTMAGRSEITAKTFRGGSRYDHNLKPSIFAFVFSDLESDKFQRLNLRNVLGGGLGWHALKTESTTLNLFAGSAYNRESFTTGLDRRSAEFVGGQDLTRELSSAISLTEKLIFYPNISQSGEYRITFDAAIVTKINRWLDWQISFNDRYTSNPVPGIKKNDVLLTAGIRFAFGDSDQATYSGADTSSGSTDPTQVTGKKKGARKSTVRRQSPVRRAPKRVGRR